MKRYVDHAMGMPISLAARIPCDEAWAAVMADLRWVDEVFSTFKPDSCVSRLARGQVHMADCPPEVAEVIALGDAAERASGGAFSIRRPGLDPSGVVKGWAVDRAARFLREVPGLDFCLSAGGDMVCRSTGQPWRVGIEHPLDPQRLIATVPVQVGAVATSGTTHRGHHLVDARDGSVPQGVSGVTVVAPTLTWADIEATAAYALGQRAAAWLSTRAGRKALVVWADGSTTLVEGQATGRWSQHPGIPGTRPRPCGSHQTHSLSGMPVGARAT